MSDNQKFVPNDFVPQRGILHKDDLPQSILCRPKLMPLKSLTSQKLENMTKASDNEVKNSKSKTAKEV